jgi:hypothetical protein
VQRNQMLMNSKPKKRHPRAAGRRRTDSIRR